MNRLITLSFLFAFVLLLHGQTTTKTVNVATAGTLSTFFTSTEINSVTNITITGFIDARDFVFMRDQMTVLSNVNLSDVKIKQYLGLNGTYLGVSLNYPANEIPMYAFYNANTSTFKSTIKTVTLPTSINSVGYLAFYYCYNLSGTFTIPAGVKSIGDYAFYGCSNIVAFSVVSGNSRYASYDGILMNSSLDSVFICPTAKSGTLSLPQTVSWIGPSAFEGCSLLTGSLLLPSNLKTIEDYAFYYCNGLSGNIAIPDNTLKIGAYAFYGCSGFNGNLNLPANLTSLGSFAFFLCDNLEYIDIESLNSKYYSLDGILYSKNIDTLLICPSAKTGNLVIPNTIKTIAAYSLYNCKFINGTINISANVDSIGVYAFYGCSQITEFLVNANNIKFSSSEGVLFSKSKNKLIACPPTKTGNFSISNSVNVIEPGAFAFCNKLLGLIHIPASVKVIGDYSFFGCSNIDGFDVDVASDRFSSRDGILFSHNQDSLFICPLSKSGKYTVPSTVSYIGYSAFDGCTYLSEIILPSSVKYIDDYAFEYCTNLTKIHLSENVNTIGKAAFYNCKNLKTFEIEAKRPPQIDYYTFDLIDKSACNLIVSQGCTSVYLNAMYWNKFANISESNFLDTKSNTYGVKVLKIYKFQNNCVVEGLTNGDIVSAFTVKGELLTIITANQSKVLLNFKNRGIYLIRINRLTYKVAI